MAGTSSMDILGSLNDVMNSILGAKTNLKGLSMNLPFEDAVQTVDVNEKLFAKMKELVAKKAEEDRLKAVAIQAAASGGAGTKIRAPARIRNRI